MRIEKSAWLLLILPVLAFAPASQAGQPIDQFLGRIRAVDREGKGNADAAVAVRELVKTGTVESLIPILKAMDGANVRVINWLRAAGDALVDKVLASKGELPLAALERFVLDTQHDGRARRTAFEWLTRVKPETPERLVSRFLNDPAAELRRDAIAVEIKKGQDLTVKEPEAATKHFLATFESARDTDQVQQIAAALQKLGKKVDQVAHLGLVEHWYLMAPFDNKDEKGFPVVYPPEKGVELSAKLKGTDGKEIAWNSYQAKDADNETDPEKLGIVDFNEGIGKLKGVIGYAVTYFDSPKEQPVEIRVGSWNALKIFLNGREVFAIEEYHHGMKLDQYVGQGVLKKGRNELLIKVCQNEETDPTSQNWKFQLRLCDEMGKGVPFHVIEEKKSRGAGTAG